MQNDISRHVKSTEFGTFILGEDTISKDILSHGRSFFWDNFIKEVFDGCLTKDSVVVEVGANFGFHTVYLSRMSRLVYAFEPQKMIYFQLCGNLFINNCSNVIPFNLALYDKHGILKPDRAIDYSQSNESAQVSFIEGSTSDENSIECVTLDSFNFPKVDFIEIDAQGADFQVVLGAQKTIERFKPIITFEVEQQEIIEKYNWKRADIFQFLSRFGYRFQFIDDEIMFGHNPSNFIAIPV